MELVIERQTFSSNSTIGNLTVDGSPFCATLELPVKDGLPGSAIPNGVYQVVVYPSPKFARDMPLIIGDPERSDIEMHWGNSAADTNGCVLLGQASNTPDWIDNSRETFDSFWHLFSAARARGEVVVLSVIGVPPANTTAAAVRQAVVEG
jgi:hypothetical protein